MGFLEVLGAGGGLLRGGEGLGSGGDGRGGRKAQRLGGVGRDDGWDMKGGGIR